MLFELFRSDWYDWADQALLRQEADSSNDEEGEGDRDDNENKDQMRNLEKEKRQLRKKVPMTMKLVR